MANKTIDIKTLRHQPNEKSNLSWEDFQGLSWLFYEESLGQPEKITSSVACA